MIETIFSSFLRKLWESALLDIIQLMLEGEHVRVKSDTKHQLAEQAADVRALICIVSARVTCA